MHALAANRMLLLVGDTLSFGKFNGFSSVTPLYKRVRFFRQISSRREPLTLASLGFEDGIAKIGGDEKNKLKQGVSTIEVPKRREKKDIAEDFSVLKKKERVEGDDKNKLKQRISAIEVTKRREKKDIAEDFSVLKKKERIDLASLGLEFEDEIVKIGEDEKNKPKQGIITKEAPKRREKKASPKSFSAFKKRERFDIEALAPFAAKSFSELGLSPLLVERLEKEGYKTPTDVQAAAIPTILKDHDVVIQSYTGSGKTLAYLLPILCEVGPFKEDAKPRTTMDIEAVVVAPSRELGMQIVREVEKLLGPEPADKRMVQQLVGGANKSRQEEALKKNKPVIVVGTPGRIAEISAAGKLQTHNCRYLVLDEVDELLAFNFRESMHRILEHVGRRSGVGKNVTNGAKPWRPERRTIMVSATVPFSVIRAARSWGHDPLLVQAKSVTPLESIPAQAPIKLSESSADSSSSGNLQTQSPVISLPPSLTHYYSVARLQHKVDTLRRCIHALDAQCVIAFMNHTKQLKDTVFKLEARGMVAAELHGDLNKLARSTILKKFKNGEVRVLLTNELSARGLDIPECDLVVNLELPTDSTHYAHRAGRTGRLGRRGTVVTICEEPEVFVVKKMQKQLGVDIQPCEFAEGKLVEKN